MTPARCAVKASAPPSAADARLAGCPESGQKQRYGLCWPLAVAYRARLRPAKRVGVGVARRDDDPNFVEAIARGFDVIKAFTPHRPRMSLSEVAIATGLARPTARRILLTLEALGYVRSGADGFRLAPRVLELGVTYIRAQGLWDIARPHMERLVAHTGESTSIAQLDGSDIVYVSRVAVPKIIALRVDIGTRFPAVATSLGKVLLAGLSEPELAAALAEPSRSGVTPRHSPSRKELADTLRQVRAKGWVMTDEQLAAGIRSVAAPLRDGNGGVIAAMNVTVHAAETSVERLTGDFLPHLLHAASDVSADFAMYQSVPTVSAQA
jgi:IclR family pca regulon transcriptional regulator